MMSIQRGPDEQVHDFDAVTQVVADPLRFKRKLAIGEDAYASLRLGKTIAQLWDVGGVAATGGTVAASTTVAGTFFATGGWLSTFGLGAAAVTPLGWVIGAALATGGAYYGVTRLFRSYHGSRVEVIPKFINSPIDLLGASLMDMIGGLSLKLAKMDGEITQLERVAIRTYFIDDWGFDPQYAWSSSKKMLRKHRLGGWPSPSRTSLETIPTAISMQCKKTFWSSFARLPLPIASSMSARNWRSKKWHPCLEAVGP